MPLMESTEPLQRCDYLLQDDSPHIVAARLTDLAQVNDQINRVNDHIREVYRIRSVFLHRVNQIRSLATTIPIEVLQLLQHQNYGPKFNLGSINTTHFAKSVIFALQHCSTYARTLNISLSLPHWCHTKVLDRLTKVFFSPEVKAKVIKLRLYKAPPQWLRLISQLRVLRSLTFDDHWHYRNNEDLPHYKEITLPPSLRSLYLRNLPMYGLAFLDQCPNLINCEYRPLHTHGSTSSSKPLVFEKLKWMVTPVQQGLQTMASVKNLQTPSVEILELEDRGFSKIIPDVIISFCCQLSSTLVSLTLNGYGFRLPLDSLKSLFRSLPHLQRFYTILWSEDNLLNAVQALTYDENSNRYIDCLPHLRKLSLGKYHDENMTKSPSRSYIEPILDLLRSRRSREGPIFCIEIAGYNLDSMSPGLTKEFKLTVEDYQIEVRNFKRRIKFSKDSADDSSQVLYIK
ncbi:hypothetical protein AGABI2DRAFT_121849 [Agaricus bisporus var. bisporus H97]|uniref:hypothetical protein n=1 Tax=Agaricus bisporus var. bisporus (strain H97 / ATCC MYA-4626 / FGSC 10389) TaxID=936046 RepID=UPI00029F802A|nr:hypothetical protein AGABI2DRAFT_121849 [Agaricus bisporus var. bisporus H97]EKV43712.1 hypothetical protein AGABI2DRAFT_121849 [Agaricus bisporus var. bisporus H97]